MNIFTLDIISHCRALAGPARTIRFNVLIIVCLFDFVGKCV